MTQAGIRASRLAGGIGRRGRRSATRPKVRVKLVVNDADALEADAEADLGDRVVSRAQQGGGPLEAAGQQVGVGRVAERAGGTRG